MHRLPATLLLICGASTLSACAQLQKKKPAETAPSNGATAAARSPADGSILKLAQIESVQAEMLPTQPAEAVVAIHGLLHDGATRVHEVQQQRLADGFVLSVVTSRPKNAVATLALIPFERSVTLSMQGMPKGPCKIVANGVTTTLVVP